MFHADRKAAVTQVTNNYNQGMQKHNSLNLEAAEEHTGCYSCQLRTGYRGNNLHRQTKAGQEKTGKTLAQFLL